MNPTPNVSQTHFHPRTESCHHKEKSRFDTLIHVIEKISAIALGIFSTYVNWQLFLPFFFVGVCIGLYSYIQDKTSCGHRDSVSSCAYGLLEQLTGVKLPRIISLMANIAVTVCHIDHHATVFVPVIGISLGAWIGKTALHYGDLAHKKISCHFARENFSPNLVLL